jgi:hypothetical protein
MDDAKAIEWLKASPCPEGDDCELCQACGHAVKAIEKLGHIRNLLNSPEATIDPKGVLDVMRHVIRGELP